MSEDRRKADQDISDIKGDIKTIVFQSGEQGKKIDKLFDLCEKQHGVTNDLNTKVAVIETKQNDQPTPRLMMTLSAIGGSITVALAFIGKAVIGK